MADPRDLLFRELHDLFLKDSGFRKKGRNSTREASDGLLLSVVLESGPSSPLGPIWFGIDLIATHPALPPNQRLLNLGLSLYVEGIQRWRLENGENPQELMQKIKTMFAATGINLLKRMSSVEGLVGIYEELDAVWYYQGHAWCLDKLNRSVEATRVIERAIARAPHDNFRIHAESLLAERLRNLSMTLRHPSS